MGELLNSLARFIRNKPYNVYIITFCETGNKFRCFYYNLCQGLLAAGHDAILATNPTLCPLAEAHGVRSAPVGPAVDMGAVGARLLAQSFGNMWIGMIRVMQLGARLVEQAYPDVLKLCRGADLVITTDSTSGIAEAENLGLPWISVTLQPGRIPLPDPHPGMFKRVLMPLINGLMMLPTNQYRKRVGAPRVKDLSSMMSARMVLLPVSRHMAQPDSRWPKQVYPTGYWFAREDASWQPPQKLLDFLAAGEKPVAVSLGVMSLSGKQARQSAQIVLEALRQAGFRAILQGWDSLLEGIDLPETVCPVGSLPHAWLFGQVSAIVHHGGFGTTAAALRSGAPGIVCRISSISSTGASACSSWVWHPNSSPALPSVWKSWLPPCARLYATKPCARRLPGWARPSAVSRMG